MHEECKENMRWQKNDQFASIPLRLVGPVHIISAELNEPVLLPLATFETPLWHSVHRGARVASRAGGIRATLFDDCMTRSILLEADSAAELAHIAIDIAKQEAALSSLVAQSSRFARLLNLHTECVGSLLYVRFSFSTGDASGHNMVTLASDRLLSWILSEYKSLRYVSISGNYCVDKKASAINGILGRGKRVVAEVLIARELCINVLKTSPEKIVDLNIKKNLLGGILSGSIRSANAHFANMLLGFYLATGQDAANIVEGSQGIVYAECREGDLYFSVTLPHLIVGTVGNGKDIPYVKEVLSTIGCLDDRTPGENAKRLAIIAAAAVLAGELSLLAAQTIPGELMHSHVKLERHEKARHQLKKES